MAAAYRIGFRGAGRRPANSCCAWRAHYHVGPAPAQRHRKHGARGQTSRHCGTVQYIFRLRRNTGRVSGKWAFAAGDRSFDVITMSGRRLRSGIASTAPEAKRVVITYTWSTFQRWKSIRYVEESR